MTIDPPPPLRSQLEIVRTASNARWGAVLAGVFVTLSAWMVLHLFGVGVGLTAISPDDPHQLRSLGLGIGVWAMVAPAVALFAGGLVASRLAPTPSRVNRMLHGVLVWSLTTLVAGAAVAMLAASFARGTATVAGDLAADTIDTSVRGLGLDARDLAAPINGRRRAEGKPLITASELERAMDDAIVMSVRAGTIDRDALVAALDESTDLGAADLDAVATELEAQWHRTAQRASALASRAQRARLAAADTTGKVLLGVSLALMFGLVSSVGGALATGKRDRRRSL
jgi:hypothetical protein